MIVLIVRIFQKLTREVLQAKRKNQRKCINMLMSKTQGGVSYGFISFITLSDLKIVLPMLCTSLHCQNQSVLKIVLPMLCTSLHCQNQSVLKIVLPMLCTSLHCQNSKCPEDRPPHALYLTPLSKL